ncbi:MAG: hypothetical protein JRJ65_09455 [Deltaproteobacteria bacterium]|nr:hypothetical protein [Deltaproteobacteria bacterium]
MSKKKRPKKRKPCDFPLLSSEEEIFLNTLLENPKNINLSNINKQIPSPELAQALVEKLPSGDSETVKLILAIREVFTQKNVQKAVKKTIFRLKQRGLFIPEPESRKGAPLLIRKTEKVVPTVYIGPIDGTGSRLIFIALPQIPKGFQVGIGAASDEEGIVDFVSGEYSKKRMKEVKDLFLEKFSLTVEASLAHAATILEKAYTRKEQAFRESSRNYLQLRPLILENVSLLDRPAIYDCIPFDSVSVETLTDSQIDKLLGHKLMESWIIDVEKMKPLADEILKVEESSIIISEGQRANRVTDIKQKGIAELYQDSRRLLLKYRLEEMAYVFFKLDEEEYVSLSLAAAFSLDDKDSPLRVNPFLMAMVERSLDYYTEMAKGRAESEGLEEDSASRIVLP